jgi:hypothetical protein
VYTVCAEGQGCSASVGARFRIGAFGFWNLHLHALLTAAGHPPLLASVLAHALLAPLGAEHLLAQLAAGIDRADLVSRVRSLFTVSGAQTTPGGVLGPPGYARYPGGPRPCQPTPGSPDPAKEIGHETLAAGLVEHAVRVVGPGA